MRKTKQNEQPADAGKSMRPLLNAIIEEQVIHALGQPATLQRIQVRELWDERYRVNVFIGPDIVSATLAHSYFLVTDDAGNIMASTPSITRQY